MSFLDRYRHHREINLAEHKKALQIIQSIGDGRTGKLMDVSNEDLEWADQTIDGWPRIEACVSAFQELISGKSY